MPPQSGTERVLDEDENAMPSAKVDNADDKVEEPLARSDSFWSPMYMSRRNGVIGARHPEPDGPKEAMADPIENAPLQT